MRVVHAELIPKSIRDLADGRASAERLAHRHHEIPFTPRGLPDRLDPAAEKRQLERTARVRAERNAGETERAIEVVREVARGEENLMVPMREALRARATIGEISNALRDEFGMYDAQR